MAEFKKLSEVEQLETASDNATVLIEEGGEIKRVPKQAVGGAGGLAVVLTLDNTTIEDGMFITTYNYDEIYDVLMAGGSVILDITQYLAAAYGGIGLHMCRVVPCNWILLDDTGLMAAGFIVSTNGDAPLDMAMIVFPNGSHHTPATT